MIATLELTAPGSSPLQRQDQAVLFRYDPEADAAYVTLLDRDLRAGEAATQSGMIEMPSGEGTTVLDFDAAGRFLGVEILGCRAVLPAELLRE